MHSYGIKIGHPFMAILAPALCLIFASAVAGQTNLLLDTHADNGSKAWRHFGSATIEEFNGKKVFVLRSEDNGVSSHFSQDVELSVDDTGKYALLIGRGSSERINANGAITGLPYLYGYMLKSKSPKGATINEYLQGQMMTLSSGTPDRWVKMYGIFRVPPGTVAVRFFLNQAERQGVPRNGSAARFDDLGLFLFGTANEAAEFAKAY